MSKGPLKGLLTLCKRCCRCHDPCGVLGMAGHWGSNWLGVRAVPHCPLFTLRVDLALPPVLVAELIARRCMLPSTWLWLPLAADRSGRPATRIIRANRRWCFLSSDNGAASRSALV
ncbi:hypothetical protein SAMN05660859_3920 [Ancylobacter rudongensis]|uniref:Uncharacterized protein n=1 Tax=Ancylobacter rudongensis TaxID=177413 RepID=A0A1G4UI53_9HYPH|nr:hypothetical protein SAMN05660859_3920 [Ancylobacter rudongensis]